MTRSIEVDGFKSGDEVYTEGGVMSGEFGRVVEWDDAWEYNARGRFRDGLVPVFLPKFSETEFWWFHPCQLRKVGEVRIPVDRDIHCPKCNGWMEHIYGSEYHCDTCEYQVNL